MHQVRGSQAFLSAEPLRHVHIYIMGLIYETNVRPKFGRTVVSTQNLEFINMDVSGGYD